MVSSELGVDGSQRSVLEGLRLLDTVLVGLLGLVVVGVVLRLRHVALNVSIQLTKQKTPDKKIPATRHGQNSGMTNMRWFTGSWVQQFYGSELGHTFYVWEERNGTNNAPGQFFHLGREWSGRAEVVRSDKQSHLVTCDSHFPIGRLRNATAVVVGEPNRMSDRLHGHVDTPYHSGCSVSTRGWHINQGLAVAITGMT